MAKEKTPGNNTDDTIQSGQNKLDASTSRKKGSGKKNNRPQVGGTAVPGAKSTQPRPVSTSSNPQQQEIDSYNRTMRRRMENIGAGPYAAENRKVKTPQERRKEKIERLKQKRASDAAAVKKSLPGGQLKTDTSRAVRMVLVVAALIILLIAVFVVLRVTGVIH